MFTVQKATKEIKKYFYYWSQIMEQCQYKSVVYNAIFEGYKRLKW